MRPEEQLLHQQEAEEPNPEEVRRDMEWVEEQNALQLLRSKGYHVLTPKELADRFGLSHSQTTQTRRPQIER